MLIQELSVELLLLLESLVLPSDSSLLTTLLVPQFPDWVWSGLVLMSETLPDLSSSASFAVLGSVGESAVPAVPLLGLGIRFYELSVDHDLAAFDGDRCVAIHGGRRRIQL
jgi:hypothetical protein